MRAAVVFGVLAAVEVVVHVTSAHAAVLCARRRADGTLNSSVRIREGCRPSEAQLDPAALGLRGPQGPAGPRLVVLDANDTLVGVVESTQGTVVRHLAGLLVRLLVTDTGFVSQPGPPSLRYETTDCTGTPFMSGGDRFVTRAEVYGTVAHFWAVPPSTRTQRSGLAHISAKECSDQNGAFTPPDLCCVSDGYAIEMQGGDLITFDLEALGLVPPFRIEMQ